MSTTNSNEKKEAAVNPKTAAPEAEQTSKKPAPQRRRAPKSGGQGQTAKTAAKTTAKTTAKTPPKKAASASKTGGANKAATPKRAAKKPAAGDTTAATVPENDTAALAGATSAAVAVTAKPTPPEKPEFAGAAQAAERAEQAEAAERAEVAAPFKPEPASPGAEAQAAEKAEAPEMAEKAEETGEALTPEEQARVATITRTAQISIEKILAGVAERENAAAVAAPESVNPPPGPSQQKPVAGLALKIGKGLGGGLWGLTKWLLLVLLFITVIAGSGIYWLYQQATPENIPAITATFNGAELETSTYNWKVPVVGELITRSYAEKNKNANATPFAVATAKPGLTVSPSGYTTELTVKDAAGKECFTGTLEEYKRYTFAANTDYTATLTVSRAASRVSGSTQIWGKQSYQFAFMVSIEPTVRISTNAVQQGSVLAVRVSGLPQGSTTAPTLQSDLGQATFAETASGWVAFLAIPFDQEVRGDYTLRVAAGAYQETMTFGVRARNWLYKDYSGASQQVSPHIGVEDTPEAVKAVLATADSQIYWAATGFVQPFLTNITVKMDFGTMEYVGRTKDQKAKNQNVNGRPSTNVLFTCSPKQDVIAPADGRILLAEDLGGSAGNTVVVEHGAGVKSIFYNLNTLKVAKDQVVRQGQLLGTTSKTMLAEVRIGQTPVEPLTIWRGQCDAMLYL